MRFVATLLVAPLIAVLVLQATLLGQVAQSPVSIAVPRLINVAGVFSPADGQPVSRVESVTLLIYENETGGAPLWQETQSVEVDPSGRYSLLMGATEAMGIPIDVFASGE